MTENIEPHGSPGFHAHLIDGLSRIYLILIDMAYLSPGDVIFQAQRVEGLTGDTEVPSAALQSVGLNIEAVELLSKLPAIRPEAMEKYSDSGVPLAPNSWALKYLGERINDEVDIRFARNGAIPLCPKEFKLSRCNASKGEDRVYNIAEGLLIYLLVF